MTIKETAGKVLLYLYQMQRSAPFAMPHRQLGFLDKKDRGLGLTSDKKWLTKDLQGINPSAEDIFNAFAFLHNKKFIQARERVTPSARVYVQIQLTGEGVDIIEGVEGGAEGQRDFEAAFNIKVGSASGVDDLIKDNLKLLSD